MLTTINISISLSISLLLPRGHDNNKTRWINLLSFERGNVVSFVLSAARCCCVTSRGKPFSHQRSPGSALRLKASLRCWFCDVTAFTKSWIRLDGLSQPMLRRESRVPGSSVCELESDEGKKQEMWTKHWRLVLNSPIWTRPQTAVRNQSVCVGRSPASHGFCGPAYVIWYLIHPMNDILTDLYLP